MLPLVSDHRGSALPQVHILVFIEQPYINCLPQGSAVDHPLYKLMQMCENCMGPIGVCEKRDLVKVQNHDSY